MRCENCGAIGMIDDPYIPLCRRCAPVESHYVSWRLIVIWAAWIVASWAVLSGIIYLFLQVLS